MKDIIMKVVPKPDDRFNAVIEYGGKPLHGNGGGLNFVCGACKHVLLENMGVVKLSDSFVKCGCGAYNQILLSDFS